MNKYILGALAGIVLAGSTEGASLTNRFSQRGINFIKEHELFSATPYPDAEGFSIGYGYHLSPGENITHVTREKAEEYLMKRVREAENVVRKSVKVPLNPRQYDALVDFCYTFDTGGARFRKTSLCRYLNQGDYVHAKEQIGKFIYSDGKIARGLITRRNDEMHMFSEGVKQPTSKNLVAKNKIVVSKKLVKRKR